MNKRLLSVLLALLLAFAPVSTGVAELYNIELEDAALPADEVLLEETLEDETGETPEGEVSLDTGDALVFDGDVLLPMDAGEDPETGLPEGLDLSEALADLTPADSIGDSAAADGTSTEPELVPEEGEAWLEDVVDDGDTAQGDPVVPDAGPAADGDGDDVSGEPGVSNEPGEGSDTEPEGSAPEGDAHEPAGEGGVADATDVIVVEDEPEAAEEPAADGETEPQGEPSESGEGETGGEGGADDPDTGEGSGETGGEGGADGPDTGEGSGETGGEGGAGDGPEEAETPEAAEAPATTITLSKTALTLGVGETLSLSATDSDETCDRIYWSSGNKKIATVSAAGAVKGVKAGTVMVRAKNANGAEAVCIVVVKAAPARVSLSPATLYLGLNERVQLKPRITSGSACSTFAWKSRDKKIAAVNRYGVIRGVARGKTQVRVTTYNGKQYIINVVVRRAATGLTLSPQVRNLGVGQVFTLSSAIKPASGAATVIYSSSDTSVAKVNSKTGKVTAVGVGECDITGATWYEGVKDTCHIRVYKAPETIEITSGSIKLHMTQARIYRVANAVKLSDDSYSDLTITSSKPSVVRVLSTGKIKAMSKGKAVITVSTYNNLRAKVVVRVYQNPPSVALSENNVELLFGQTHQFTVTLPSYSSPRDVTYRSSNPKIASVSEDGLVTAGSVRGTATITVTTVNGKRAKAKVKVMDPNYPERASITKKPSTLHVGQTYQIKGKVVPSSANPKFKWSSSNTSVLTVSSTGLLTAHKQGTATVTAISKVNPSIRFSFKVTVWIKQLTLTIPARTTKLTSGKTAITKNLSKIEAVRKSATWMIDWHLNKGQISTSDANKRKSIINNAFRDYAFPWVTLKYQRYWRAANSEGGAKDFKPGTVYFGMPYISGAGGNRAYNRSKALSQSRYTSSGKGYYVLNQKKLLDGLYCGNDCSCFVDAAIWGTGSTHSWDRTTEIAKSSAYRTVSFSSMRPGDLICKGGSHVVMFLYYVNAQKTKIMMIENGGAEKGTNTVHCDIYDLSYYTKRGYSVRRLRSLG